MWVLVAAAFVVTSPGAAPQPHASVMDTFPTASACHAVKKELDKAITENLNPAITTWGTDCVELKTDKQAKVAEKHKS